MSEPSTQNGSVQRPGRPFPWFCPRCRHKEVWQVTVPYQCQRLHNGQPITVTLASLTVPKCAHCGELVFNYEAEQQINEAYKAQTAAACEETSKAVAPAQPTVDKP
jgi:hypothetical protein